MPAMDHDHQLLLYNITPQYQLELGKEEFLDRARLLTVIFIVGPNDDHA